MFSPSPRGRAGGGRGDGRELDALLHLYMLNRGILFTPFHMMALISPATTAAQVDATPKRSRRRQPS